MARALLLTFEELFSDMEAHDDRLRAKLGVGPRDINASLGYG